MPVDRDSPSIWCISAFLAPKADGSAKSLFFLPLSQQEASYFDLFNKKDLTLELLYFRSLWYFYSLLTE
ncbi:MAG TPA: hypothetical protein DCZ48_13465, partial [Methylococcaceae bacterium]|nr:hypothetical protein [Methylococcaceae bacterium]